MPESRLHLPPDAAGGQIPVNHSRGWVHGEAHTSHIESAWCLFKRRLIGVYHRVSAKRLQEYLDEFAFRGSHRSKREAMVSPVLASCRTPFRQG